MRYSKSAHWASALAVAASMSACTPTETHQSLEPQRIAVVSPSFAPVPVSIGAFVNRSTYMNGIFSDSNDRLGQQAQQILTTHLSDSRAFTVMDRRNLDALAQESKYAKNKQDIAGAQVVITGAVTEFGRRETGTRGLGGLISKSKTQTLYAKVSLSVVDVRTSKVLGSYQGAGEYALTNSEVLGTGGTAGYDSTLADKVLNLAIMEAVQRVVAGKNNGEW
jgi:curli biogenesis system outer membrane secretion channel CsgG